MTRGERQGRPDSTLGARGQSDLDDALRRALHAAVDHIEPADDGLTRILHRLTTSWMVRHATLLVSDCVDLARLIPIRLEPAYTVATRLKWRHHTGPHRRIPYQAAWAWLRLDRPWLRPALAVVAAVAIVLMGAVAVGQIHQIVTRASLNADTGATTPTHAGAQSAGDHGPSPTPNVTRTGPTGPGVAPGPVKPSTHRSSCVPMSCPPGAGTTPTPAPVVTPSGQPSGTPSQGPAPTPTPSKTNHGHHKPHPAPPTPPPHGHKGRGGL